MLNFYKWSKKTKSLNDVALNLFFDMESQKEVELWRRKRKFAGARFLRILFPRFIITATTKEQETKFKLKPDGWASLFYFVFVAVSLIAVLDKEGWDDNYPRWAPFAMLFWYLSCAIYELIKTKEIFKKTN